MDPKLFWARVDVAGVNECWPWKGARFHFGHGAVKFRGKQDRAHRVAWMLTNGDIPNGSCVLHRCDNPPCCNPAHLAIGTKSENAADRHQKSRDARGQRSGRYTMPERTASRGRNGRAKLTEEHVVSIRAARESGMTLAAIAAQFGVGTTTVSAITRGERWQ